jgi:glycosyltransferase involved in cell wall biosynthesis
MHFMHVVIVLFTLCLPVFANDEIDVSVYVVCKNEEKHIKRLLDNVKEFKEVILVDSGSTDKTLEIARKYQNVKIYHHPWVGYAKQKAYALSLCTSKWVLNLDADEELSLEMKQEMIEMIKAEDADGLLSERQFYYLGEKPNPYVNYDKHLRFFKKDKGCYDVSNLVHEGIEIDGKIKKGKGVFFDFGTDSIAFQMQKQNEYSTLGALEKFKKGIKTSVLKVIFTMPFAFIKHYFIKRHFLNGLNGFIYAVNAAYYSFLKESKLYELWKS